MSTDAFLTVLGPGLVQRWTVESHAAFLEARRRELSLLE
jgi:hypothetical protein